MAFMSDIWNFKASSRFYKRWENVASHADENVEKSVIF